MQVIIQLATGVASTTTQVGAWLALGLTVDQVFVEFALGDQYTAFSKSAIQQYLTTAADAAIGSTGHGAVQVTGISADVNHGAAVHA
jgi:hypothetical protein